MKTIKLTKGKSVNYARYVANFSKSSISEFECELLQHKTELQHSGLFISDPLLPDYIGLIMQAIELCNDNSIRVIILSENPKGLNTLMDFIRDLDTSKIAIGVIFKDFSDKLKVKALKRANLLEIKTFVNIESIISEEIDTAKKVIIALSDYVDYFRIGLDKKSFFQKKDVVNFWNDLVKCFDYKYISTPFREMPKIYLHDNIVNKIGNDRMALPKYCVSISYNLWQFVR